MMFGFVKIALMVFILMKKVAVLLAEFLYLIVQLASQQLFVQNVVLVYLHLQQETIVNLLLITVMVLSQMILESQKYMQW
jgi:hypothetical protein